MARHISVYVLIDTRTSRPFYVGSTLNMEKRLEQHVRGNRWRGVVPTMERLGGARGNASAERFEQFWINYFRAFGEQLDNGKGHARRNCREAPRKPKPTFAAFDRTAYEARARRRSA